MKTIISGRDRYLLRFDRGEDVMVELKRWADQFGPKDLPAATFTMLGATDKITLAYYDVPEKKYIDTVLTEDLEIIVVTGNLTWKKDDAGKLGAAVHSHGTVGGRQCQVWGGHIKELFVSITCEVSVIVMKGEGEAIRVPSETWCGLALMA